MRNTKQKDLVFSIIDNSYDHLTAKQVYEIAVNSITNISLGTVYRIVNSLASNHQIIRIPTKSGIDHFDRIPIKRHSHFICDECYKIVDIFKVDYNFNKDEFAQYKINDVEITFTGICNECMKGRN